MGRKKKPEGRGGDGLFYDEKSQSWGFRIKRENKDIRRKGFKNKTEAKRERLLFLSDIEKNGLDNEKENEGVYTLEYVFNHYLNEGASDKRDATIKRQKSLFKNHLGPRFGNRPIAEITAGELSNYLSLLYSKGDGYSRYKKNEGLDNAYSYAYVEGFYKFIYMLWVYARKMGFIEKNVFEEVMIDDITGYQMPKRHQDDIDDENIVTHSQEEINRMRERLKNTDCLTAFEIGYYLGVRVSECYGLMFSDFDFENQTVNIERQLLFQSDNVWALVPLKTTAAVRKIYVPSPLIEIIKAEKEKQEENKKKYKSGWKGNEIVRVRMKKGQDDELRGGDFVNRSRYGDLFTSDSFGSWHRKFKSELGIEFKYHNLRHTHASLCAAENMPIMELLRRMGHKKISTTQKYYLGKNDVAEEKALKTLKNLFE